MIDWLVAKFKRLHLNICLHRAEKQREAVVEKLTSAPDGPLKQHLLGLLEAADVQLKTMRKELEAVKQGFPEPWQFEVPTESDLTQPQPRPKTRIED